MNLLLLTHEFPYGVGETYIETEIKFASKHFDRVDVISLSRYENLTREVPENVYAHKRTKKYKLVNCLIYALAMLFTKETFSELMALKKLEHSPSLIAAVKEWVKCRMVFKRIDLTVKELGLGGEDTIAYSYWLNEGAYYLSRRKKKFRYTISRAHGYELRDNEHYTPFRRTIDKGIDEISFISQAAQREYDRIMRPLGERPVTAKKAVRHLGVSDRQKKPEAYEDKTFRIASCSAIYELKRLDIIVDALEILPEDCKIEWIHFGSGIDGEKIKQRCIDKLFSKPNIKCRGFGWVSNSEVQDYYSTHNISLFVNSSNIEGIPVAIMEAQSFGIPSVARAVGGNPEIVRPNESGYLLAADAGAEEFAQVFEDVIRNPQSIVSTDSVKKFYNSEFNADKNYEDFYNYLLAR